MIWAVVPGTVGLGHGSAAVVAFAPPTPAAPEVAVAVGVAAHCAGLLPVMPLGAVGVVGVAAVGAPALALPAAGVPPPVLALALVAPASANAAKLGTMKWDTRKSS